MTNAWDPYIGDLMSLPPSPPPRFTPPLPRTEIRPAHVLICLLGEVCGSVAVGDEVAVIDLVRVHLAEFPGHGDNLRLVTPEHLRRMGVSVPPPRQPYRAGRASVPEDVRAIGRRLFEPVPLDYFGSDYGRGRDGAPGGEPRAPF